MRIMEMSLTALKFEDYLVRWPLMFGEQQMAARMDPEEPAVLLYERSLGMLDAMVGSALHTPVLTQRGALLIERSDSLRGAAQLDSEASNSWRRAVADPREVGTAAESEGKSAREQKAERINQARADAQGRKRATADDAENRTAVVRIRKQRNGKAPSMRSRIWSGVPSGQLDETLSGLPTRSKKAPGRNGTGQKGTGRWPTDWQQSIGPSS
jgi:hypothetical protein